LCHWIGLDFLFQNNPIITAEKQTVNPGNEFKDILLFRAPFEMVKFYIWQYNLNPSLIAELKTTNGILLFI
jgi:hypothetical protein